MTTLSELSKELRDQRGILESIDFHTEIVGDEINNLIVTTQDAEGGKSGVVSDELAKEISSELKKLNESNLKIAGDLKPTLDTLESKREGRKSTDEPDTKSFFADLKKRFSGLFDGLGGATGMFGGMIDGILGVGTFGTITSMLSMIGPAVGALGPLFAVLAAAGTVGALVYWLNELVDSNVSERFQEARDAFQNDPSMENRMTFLQAVRQATDRNLSDDVGAINRENDGLQSRYTPQIRQALFDISSADLAGLSAEDFHQMRFVVSGMTLNMGDDEEMRFRERFNRENDRRGILGGRSEFSPTEFTSPEDADWWGDWRAANESEEASASRHVESVIAAIRRQQPGITNAELLEQGMEIALRQQNVDRQIFLDAWNARLGSGASRQIIPPNVNSSPSWIDYADPANWHTSDPIAVDTLPLGTPTLGSFGGIPTDGSSGLGILSLDDSQSGGFGREVYVRASAPRGEGMQIEPVVVPSTGAFMNSVAGVDGLLGARIINNTDASTTVINNGGSSGTAPAVEAASDPAFIGSN